MGHVNGRRTAYHGLAAGEPAGRSRLADRQARKVRAPQGRVVGNADPGRPAGKCHRKQTAPGPVSRGKGETVV
jgi:hypothetical protein